VKKLSSDQTLSRFFKKIVGKAAKAVYPPVKEDYMNTTNYTAPIALKDISIRDAFWGPIVERVRGGVLPYQWEALNDRIEGAEKSFCVRNFKLAAELTHPELDYAVPKDIGHGGFVFQDSDLAKWLEAVAYTLVWRADAALETVADEVIDVICNAQQPDGYLNTYYIINGLDKRFTNLKDNHELYCLGHFIEAAVAYHEATGKDALLNAVLRYVDCVDALIGPEAGKLHGYPGHEIIEMALARLYALTKDEKHLRLAKYFIDERGKPPLYFAAECAYNGNDFYWKNSSFQYQYYQAGKPVREQHKAEGHAVRAVYLYSGMADIARLTGDETLFAACAALWDDISRKQMYITGSIGQSAYGEAFSFAYDLPNDTAYAETCAAIGLVFFAQRMIATSTAPRGDYGDVIERALYNGISSGISLDGKKFFYVNPLEATPEASEKSQLHNHVKVERQKWFGCACCPPNIARLFTSIGTYVHSANERALYTHLFIGSEARTVLDDKEVVILIETKYPWEERVAVTFRLSGSAKFRYGVRIPAWCADYRVELNGASSAVTLENGYALFDRVWRDGDTLALTLAMPVTLREAHPRVREDAGKVAVTRGPMVYCLEEVDNGKQLFKVRLDDETAFTSAWEAETLGGVVTLTSKGCKQRDWEQSALYRSVLESAFDDCVLRWIPYYAWANRTAGEMLVWVRRK
jgi:DUF1680 family protein